MSRQQSAPDLYQSTAHPCPYLPSETASNLLIDPKYSVSSALYDTLIRNGFRRNGALFYRPHCPSCRQCQSVRIRVKDFAMNRAFRRTWKRNQDVSMEIRTLSFREEHFTLYRNYQAKRHPGDSMDNPDPEKYQKFMTESGVDSFMMELRIGKQLLSVSVVDHVGNGLSAVYTFFDPSETRRSPGTLTILHQIELTRSVDYDNLYLGYWIEDCPKMSYKTQFSPVEIFDPLSQAWSTPQ